MENIKENEDINKYMNDYFEKNEEYFLRPNHRAPNYPELKERMMKIDLKERLEWAKKSAYKKIYGDPVQTSLFESFSKDDIAQLLLTYDFEDKKEIKDLRFFEKIPQKTMQSLFLYKDAIHNITNEDLIMLATEYSIQNNNSIYDFIKTNKEEIPKILFDALYLKMQSEKNVKKIDDEFGELEPRTIRDFFGIPKGR
ncbi:MAG: hypothetical protein PHR09_04145 [Bacilli bacterium]|nr:hypothetical protein [Bacilli bacterium]